MEDLTFKTLLGHASSLAAPTNLQVVLNSDIVLGNWSAVGKCRLHDIHSNRKVLHLSRTEPKSCFPLLDKRPRKQHSFSAPDKSIYASICDSKWSAFSKDALAFNVPIPKATLAELDFTPNRHGAANQVGCLLDQADFLLTNPCQLLRVYHNHCTDDRSSPEDRIEKPGCEAFRVRRTTSFSDCCGVPGGSATKVATQGEGFADLHVINLESGNRQRDEEYCVTLLMNVKNPIVRQIHVYTTSSRETAKKRLHDCGWGHGKISVEHFESLNDLTYMALLVRASASATACNLQVVLNSDIVLGNWSALGSCHLRSIHVKKKIFHLSRIEPKSCFPLLDRRPREQVSFAAPDNKTYSNICGTHLSRHSKDAIAFNVHIPKSTLAKLNFPPNRLGAENLLGCRLAQAGLVLENPCGLLRVYHNHCTDQRSYSTFRIDAIAKGCMYFGVDKSYSLVHGCDG